MARDALDEQAGVGRGRELQVVGRDELALAAAGNLKARPRRVVAPAREQREREVRMRRAALAQVDLDRVRLPRAGLVAHDDEVDREAADDALARQPLARRRAPAR